MSIALSSFAGTLSAAAAIGLHPVPEVNVVVVLAGIVEEAGVLAEDFLDDISRGSSTSRPVPSSSLLPLVT